MAMPELNKVMLWAILNVSPVNSTDVWWLVWSFYAIPQRGDTVQIEGAQNTKLLLQVDHLKHAAGLLYVVCAAVDNEMVEFLQSLGFSKYR